MLRKITIITILMVLDFVVLHSQINQDSIQNQEQKDTIIVLENDTTALQNDTTVLQNDTTTLQVDSVFLARQKFIADSLHKRKLIKDSVVFLQKELPKLLEAAARAESEAIVISYENVNIIGDSALDNFSYRILTRNISGPYTPWLKKVVLSAKNIKIEIDTTSKSITKFSKSKKHYKFSYSDDKKVVAINKRGSIISKKGKNYYKLPIDSVFFDENNKITMIKTYIHYFNATKNYRKSDFLYFDIDKIKKFKYFTDGVLSYYEIIKYCSRWDGGAENKQCHIVTNNIIREGNKFTVKEHNKPENKFSDGTFIYEFDDSLNLKSMEFKGADKHISKMCFVELNKEGNVSRYLFKKDGFINRTLMINYNDNPNADYKYEIITCYYEKDRVCYFQKNNRTGQSRRRDRLTLKWSKWK